MATPAAFSSSVSNKPIVYILYQSKSGGPASPIKVNMLWCTINTQNVTRRRKGGFPRRTSPRKTLKKEPKFLVNNVPRTYSTTVMTSYG